jgi:hypothetical protein
MPENKNSAVAQAMMQGAKDFPVISPAAPTIRHALPSAGTPP